MPGAPRELTELTRLEEDVTRALVASLESHVVGHPKRRRQTRHGTLVPSQIRALRALLGLSQNQFARQLGTDKGTVAAWENARRSPNRTFSHKLRRLAQFNKIDVEKLVEVDYVKTQMKARVTMEPVRAVMEKLERIVEESQR